MWREQMDMGMIPYYLIVVRDTGAFYYFGMSLMRAREVFRDAYQRVRCICGKVRGPSISAHPGKVQMLGVSEVRGEKTMTLRFSQGCNPHWIYQPFLARNDEDALRLDDIPPHSVSRSFYLRKSLSKGTERNGLQIILTKQN